MPKSVLCVQAQDRCNMLSLIPIALSWFRRLKGSILNSLTMFLKCFNDDLSVLFTGKKWLQGKIYVGRHAAPFKVIFEAERSYTVFGDISIDDVSFVNCSLPPVVSRCKIGQHRCARGSCIDPRRLCDYTDDCGDNSDEINCYTYNYRYRNSRVTISVHQPGHG